MKYQIVSKETGEAVNGSWIVTQDGLVASWDESQGWAIETDQSVYEIVVED